MALPGTLSLLEDLDKLVSVTLHDGKTLIGYLRTIDQFGNIVLYKCHERIHVKNLYCDIERGLFLIRGENIVTCGEVKEDFTINTHCTAVDREEINRLKSQEIQKKRSQIELRRRIFEGQGLIDMLNDD